MNKDTKNTTCLACSIFKAELDSLLGDGIPSLPVNYIGSMMHMRPELLRVKMDSKIEKLRQSGNDVILLFGECHNRMDEYEQNKQVFRVPGCNCIEILLGKESFYSLLREGAFFLIYEWALRWREIFEFELDLKGNTAREFMQEMHTHLLYLNTGVHKVPEEMLKEASDYLGLPYHIHTVNLDTLKNAILNTLECHRGNNDK